MCIGMSLHQCKIVKYFIYIKEKTKMTTISGFFPHWVSTLNLGVHVCYLCVMVYFVLIAHGYNLFNV